MLQVSNYLIRQTWRSVHACCNKRLHVKTPWLSARALEICRQNDRDVGCQENTSRLVTSLAAQEDCNPFSLIAEDSQNTYNEVMSMLQKNIKNTDMYEIANSYYRGLGDTVGITAAASILLGKALNYHMFNDGTLMDEQVKVVAIMDLINSVTMLRDDIIDNSKFRRGHPTAHCIWNPYQVVVTGNMVLGICFSEAAKLTSDVNLSVCQMHEITQKGQFMQFREVLDEDFLGHYLTTHDHKTASLLRHVAVAVARAGRTKEPLVDIMSRLGYYMGICGGFIDDITDLEDDLRNGRITAPTIFAIREHPELKEIILRKFSVDGDMEKAMDLVANSQGLEEARSHVRRYNSFTMGYLNLLADSPYKRAFETLLQLSLLRMEDGADINEQFEV